MPLEKIDALVNTMIGIFVLLAVGTVLIPLIANQTGEMANALAAAGGTIASLSGFASLMGVLAILLIIRKIIGEIR